MDSDDNKDCVPIEAAAASLEKDVNKLEAFIKKNIRSVYSIKLNNGDKRYRWEDVKRLCDEYPSLGGATGTFVEQMCAMASSVRSTFQNITTKVDLNIRKIAHDLKTNTERNTSTGARTAMTQIMATAPGQGGIQAQNYRVILEETNDRVAAEDIFDRVFGKIKGPIYVLDPRLSMGLLAARAFHLIHF